MATRSSAKAAQALAPSIQTAGVAKPESAASAIANFSSPQEHPACAPAASAGWPTSAH